MSGIEEPEKRILSDDPRHFDEDGLARHLSARLFESHAETVGLLRRTFPDVPTSRRIAPSAVFHLRGRRD